MKKLLSIAMATLMAFGGLLTGVGCKVKDNIVSDDKTINVRLYKAGFGERFLYEFKDKFEAAYAEEGYKFNILTPQYTHAGTPMIDEMYEGYEKKKIDLYITGAIIPNQVSSKGIYKKELCENLEDLVFTKTAINYDLTESSNTINQRLSSDLKPFTMADSGETYGFTWAQTSAGLVVNTKKLAAYGVTELPRTTNEMFAIFDLILEKEAEKPTKTHPVTYNLSIAQGGASTYQECALETWMAQYDVDTFNEFFRMQTKGEDGTWMNMEEPWKVFENENWKPVLETSYHFMDEKYSADGSGDTTMKLDQTQKLIMDDANGQNNAIFMLNGDWFLNEVGLTGSNKTRLHNIEFINVPVISALGVKLFGTSTKYGLSDAQCDEVLSLICKLVDENKLLSEIISTVEAEKGVALDEADAQAVVDARGVTYARGIEHLAFIPKGCAKKDIAALALRMMASDDYAETFLEYANGLSPYATNIQKTSEYKFVNQAKAIAMNVHFRGINGRVQEFRNKVMGGEVLFPGERNLALTLYTRPASETYAEAAEKLYNESINKAKKAWDEYND